MTEVTYSKKFIHRCKNLGTVNMMMGLSVLFKKDFMYINNLVQSYSSIDRVIDVLKENFSLHNFKPSKYHHFFITVIIDDEKFILSHELKILTQYELDSMLFEPYIKYDVKDVREASIEVIECRLLECKSIEEQVSLIETYLKRPTRRYKKWLTKPTKLSLYHSYEKSPKLFDIKIIEKVTV